MFKSFLKKLAIITLELTLISGALWFVAEKKGIQTPAEIMPALKSTILQTENKLNGKPQEAVFPALENSTVRTFNWQFKGAKYSLSETLYQSVYGYYGNQPKVFSYTGALPQNWEETYYGTFLRSNENDKTISELAGKLQDLGRAHKLTDDQIVDLTLAFVQAIPYDDARAKDILSEAGDVAMQYPYETLFRQSGVCSDKSLLATVILRRMGYGTALFAYEQDNHMAIGIECPVASSTYGSGYCYAETTSVGNKIGIIPNFDAQSNKTVDAAQLSAFGSDQSAAVKLQQLGQVTMLQKTVGRQYSGIIETQKIMGEIEQLKSTIEKTLPEIQIQKKAVAGEEKKLQGMKADLTRYQNSQDTENFNALVPKYNSLLAQYENDVKKYNNMVNLYNKTIQRYNILIRQ